MKNVRAVLGCAVLVAGLSGIGGCKGCDDLIQQVCTDLGPTDCKYWKDHGWDQKMIPSGRGVNKACGMMLGDNVYPELIKAARNTVKVNREGDAIKEKYKQK